MSFLHPKRHHRSGDVLDPLALNENLQPIAQKLGGRINEHDIGQVPFDISRVASQAVYIPYYSVRSVNPALKFGATEQPPQPNQTNVYRVRETMEWQLMDDSGASGDTSMLRTISTGEDVLWIIAWVQYWQINQDDSTLSLRTLSSVQRSNTVRDGDFNDWRPVRMQFAIRLDGQIIEDSIPGEIDLNLQPPIPRLPQNRKSEFLTIHVPHAVNAVSMAAPLMPVRIGAVVPVSEGSHTIEFVCRRVFDQQSIELKQKFAQAASGLGTDFIEIGSRKLLVVDLRSSAKASGPVSTFAVSAFEDGDTVTVANLVTNGVSSVAAEINDLGVAALARGALNANHLPSGSPGGLVTNFGDDGMATDAAIAPALRNTTPATYPGYGTISANWVTPGTTGPGAGTLLRTTQAAMDFTTNPRFVIVLANLMLNRLHISTGVTEWNLMGAFAIQYRLATGVNVLVGENEGYVSAHVHNEDALRAGTPNESMFVDVPLFAVFDFRTVPPAANISYFEVVVSCLDGTGTARDVRLTWQNGGISIIALRA